MKNNRVYEMSSSKFLIVVFTFSFLLSSFTYAQERTLTLDISVANPSDEEAQEVEVKVDLPQELKEKDIVSSDGLKIGFDAEKKCLFVEGRVLLQPAETTIYKIVVQDAWMIPEEEIERLRLRLANLVSNSERSVFNRRLNNILKRQKDSLDDIKAHILAYRENKKEFSEIKNELQLISSGLKISRSREQRIIRFILWVVILTGGISLGLVKRQYFVMIIDKLREKGIMNRRRFVRLPDNAETQIRLLPEEEFEPIVRANNISHRGVSVSLDKAYPPHSAIELKLKLPACIEILTFKGFVVWCKKVSPASKSEYYLTGISFAEVAQEHYQRLKDFIAAQNKNVNTNLK